VLRRLRTLVIGAFVLGAVVPVALATSAPIASAAAVITVTTTIDGGPQSLRQAFLDANAGGIDTTIELTQGEYDLTDCTTDGGALLHNAAGTDLTLIGHGSTIRQTCPDASVITDLSSAGSLTVQGVWLTGATSGASGGAISGGNWGGVTVVDSTISGNTAKFGGGGIFSSGPLTIVNSTIAFNGSGITSTSGGIRVFEGDLVLVYSTVVSNNGGSVPGNNVANVWVERGDLVSFASVVARPDNAPVPNCVVVGTTESHGYNFSDDSSCDFAEATDRQDAGDPGLFDLADNGGGTPTMATDGPASPLSAAIPEAACQNDGASGITTDQRGFPRPGARFTACPPALGQQACTIGAYEDEYGVGPVCPAPSPGPPIVVPPRFTG
jgi:predicted outer membrane repeat protein